MGFLAGFTTMDWPGRRGLPPLFLKRSRKREPALGLIRAALKKQIGGNRAYRNTRKHVSGWETRGMEPVKQTKRAGSSENG